MATMSDSHFKTIEIELLFPSDLILYLSIFFTCFVRICIVASVLHFANMCTHTEIPAHTHANTRMLHAYQRIGCVESFLFEATPAPATIDSQHKFQYVFTDTMCYSFLLYIYFFLLLFRVFAADDEASSFT